jgi:hypothetical protein
MFGVWVRIRIRVMGRVSSLHERAILQIVRHTLALNGTGPLCGDTGNDECTESDYSVLTYTDCEAQAIPGVSSACVKMRYQLGTNPLT